MKTTLAASVQAKHGRLYAVIQTKVDGKRKTVWRALGLEEGASPAKTNKAYRAVVAQFEEEYETELRKKTCPLSESNICDFMQDFLSQMGPKLQISTINAYRSMINGRITQYFQPRTDLTVGSLNAKDITAFYDWILNCGSTSGTVLHYHALMRKAFKLAVKEDVILINPFDKVDRPCQNKFYGDHYSEDELKKLLELTVEDPIYPAIILAGGMGLRRSEALGVRWSRIDFEKRTVLLDTKIIECSEYGRTVLTPVEEMKNKSSRRTLPIPDPVYDMLLLQRKKQKYFRKLFKTSYNLTFEDYVCVDQLGRMMRPSYVTQHFNDISKKYKLRKIRFHDLRHTFASLLLTKEIPLINVSNFLGHSDISTTANIYAHLDRESKQASADVITNILNNKKKS